jgi:hypothetical protein
MLGSNVLSICNNAINDASSCSQNEKYIINIKPLVNAGPVRAELFGP